MSKRFIAAAAVLVIAIVATSLVFANSHQRASEQKLRITASFYPLAEFSRQIGGEKVRVSTVTPAGVEPHDFEPSPRDVVAIQKADVFVYSGTGFEPWAQKLLSDLKGGASLNASAGIELKAGDGHYYLDPIFAQKAVDNIARKLAQADPPNREFYETNAAAYKEKLTVVDREYKEALANPPKRIVITSHAAFTYLADRYGFRQVAIAGLAEEEPSPKHLAEVAELAKENGVRYVFLETLASPRLAKTIADEVGADTLVLNPLEGLTAEEEKAGKDFIGVMRENLRSLRKGLEVE